MHGVHTQTHACSQASRARGQTPVGMSERMANGPPALLPGNLPGVYRDPGFVQTQRALLVKQNLVLRMGRLELGQLGFSLVSLRFRDAFGMLLGKLPGNRQGRICRRRAKQQTRCFCFLFWEPSGNLPEPACVDIG